MIPTLSSLGSSYSMPQHVEKQRKTLDLIPIFSNDSDPFHASSHNVSSDRGYNQRFHFEPKRNPHNSRKNYSSNPISPHHFDPRRTPSSNTTIAASCLFCKYCKKTGHLINKCYKLHGFPSNFKFTKGRKTVSLVQTDSHIADPKNFSLNIDDGKYKLTKDQF